MLPATSADVLLAFRAHNSRSLYGTPDEPQLNLIAFGLDEEDLALPWSRMHHVLPCLALFGANGSGKSNVLAAIGDMRTAVLDSCRAWTGWDDLPHAPFLLNADTTQESSSYEVNLLLDGVRWRYGFELGAHRVEREWIHSYTEDGERAWLLRDTSSDQPMRWGRDITAPTTVLEQITRDNALVLSTAGAIGDPSLAPLYRWFTTITGPLTADSHEQHLLTVQALRRDPDLYVRMGQLLSAIDPLITGTTVEPLTSEVLVRHRTSSGHEVTLPWQSLSRGTRNAATTLRLALHALDHGHRLLLDDFGAGLHPRLSTEIIRLFTTPRVNTRRAQLITATHDTSLLGPAHAPALAPHHVVVVAKNATGQTTLTPLGVEHGEREDIQASYLTGAFGGTPGILDGALGRQLRR